MIGHCGDKSFQAIDCTRTDNEKQETQPLHTPQTQQRNRKPALTNKTINFWSDMLFTTSIQETEQALFLQP